MQRMHVEAGATIFRTGDASLAVYVIEDGEVVITVGDAAADTCDAAADTVADGATRITRAAANPAASGILDPVGPATATAFGAAFTGSTGAPASGIEVVRLHAGELFGESGVLEARTRAATATAVTATTLLVTDAENFFHAFGMDNDRALALVKLLCRRLRDTSRRATQAAAAGTTAAGTAGAFASTPSDDIGDAVIRLMPDRGRLVTTYHMTPIDVRHLPFQVGNRYGGETLPTSSDHGFCMDAPGETELACPHFEIVRCDGELGVRDLGSRAGTIINGTVVDRDSPDRFVALFAGANDVVAGRPNSPFRFRIQVREV